MLVASDVLYRTAKVYLAMLKIRCANDNAVKRSFDVALRDRDTIRKKKN